MRSLCFAAMLFSSSFAYADTAQVLGWSPDAKYVAVIIHGTGEGSGHPFATLTIYATKTGKVVGEPERVELGSEGASEAEAVNRVMQLGQAHADKLKVKRWLPANEIAHDEKGELREGSGVPIGTVEIITRLAKKNQATKVCDEPMQPLLLQLVIHWMDDDKPFKVLDEKKVPKERACISGCTLGTVFAYEKSALFMLSCTTAGFEGSAQSLYPVFANKLPYNLHAELPGH